MAIVHVKFFVTRGDVKSTSVPACNNLYRFKDFLRWFHTFIKLCDLCSWFSAFIEHKDINLNHSGKWRMIEGKYMPNIDLTPTCFGSQNSYNQYNNNKITRNVQTTSIINPNKITKVAFCFLLQ